MYYLSYFTRPTGNAFHQRSTGVAVQVPYVAQHFSKPQELLLFPTLMAVSDAIRPNNGLCPSEGFIRLLPSSYSYHFLKGGGLQWMDGERS